MGVTRIGIGIGLYSTPWKWGFKSDSPPSQARFNRSETGIECAARNVVTGWTSRHAGSAGIGRPLVRCKTLRLLLQSFSPSGYTPRAHRICPRRRFGLGWYRPPVKNPACPIPPGDPAREPFALETRVCDLRRGR